MTMVPGPVVDTIEAERVQLDVRFADVSGGERVERLFTGGRWLEGPVHVPAHNCLLFSDIPNDRILRYDEISGAISIFRQPAGNTNGHTLDTEGRLVSCEHGNRRVTRTEHSGALTVLADSFEGGRLNSPNDVVVKRDGSVWFTDPPYGSMSDYEGHRGEFEIGGNHVYRIAASGELTAVATDFNRPNGLVFSLDETKLYVVDTPEKHIRVFDVTDDGGLTGGEVFAECTAGSFDGLRIDTAGRIWAATHEGAHCFADDGTLVGKLLLPEICSNLTFGGPKRNRLYLTATTSLYSWMGTFNGAPQPFDQLFDPRTAWRTAP